jgi:hypothetical protein
MSAAWSRRSAFLLLALTLSRVASATNAQTPVVTDIDPDSVPEGASSFTLSVEGSGFFAPILGPSPSPGTIVRVALPGFQVPQPLPTTFVSATELSVAIPGSDTALTRLTLAQQTALGQFTEQAITAFLNSTGGFFCSYADVCTQGGGSVTDSTGTDGWRYVETLYRLGLTGRACTDPNSAIRIFCPTASANVLGAAGAFGIEAINRELDIQPPGGLFVSAPPIPLQVLAPTPTPPSAPEIPTLSRGGLIGMLGLLALAGFMALRPRSR